MNDDLRKQIEQCIVVEHGLAAKSLVDDLMHLFAEQLAARELSARIDELGHVDGLPQCFRERNGMIVHMPIDKRLHELREELKGLTAPQGEAKG